MGYKCSFLDNESYDAADVSRAFSRLTTEGVLAYPETETVAEALNTLTAEVASEGVGEYGAMAVTVTDTAIAVGAGTAFFKSGVAVEIDSDGMETERPEGECYVALIYEEARNRIVIYAGSAEATGDFVPLAKIGADGTVADMRKYARTKLIPNSANVLHEFSVVFPGFKTYLTSDGAVKTYELPHTDYKYLILKGWDGPDINYYKRGEVADISGTDATELYLSRSSNNFRLYVQRDGDVLKLAALGNSAGSEMTFSLILV